MWKWLKAKRSGHALVKFGGGIIEMSGKLGGNVFAHNKGGHYVRAYVTPVNPNTARQQAVRAALAFLTARWSATLTAAQRTAWNLYGSSVAMVGKFGETIYHSGFNHFIRSNNVLARIGFPTIDDGPVIFEIPAHDPTMSVTGSEATQLLTVNYDDTMDWDNETGGFLWVFQGKPQNTQINFFGGPWRFLAGVSGATGAPVASPFIPAVVFAIAEGQRQWIYARIQRADGRLSEPFRADCLIGA